MSIRYKPLFISIAIIGVIGSSASYQFFEKDELNPISSTTQQSKVKVDVAEVLNRNIIDWQEYSGRLEAINQVEIRPQTSGKIVAVHFVDGAYVEKGDPLFTIDPRPYEVELKRANAQLTEAKAKLALASSNLSRNQRLIISNAISQQELEETTNEALSARSNLEVAKAAIESARLNLEYTNITAPISGRISRAKVTLGNIVNVGEATPSLTNIVALSNLYASFDIDENTFLKIIRSENKDSKTKVYMSLSDETDFLHEGVISSFDNSVNTNTGTIKAQAIFSNKSQNLMPGLFTRIRFSHSSQPYSAILITPKAVGVDQDKRFVIVVNNENKTSYREVKLGGVHEGLQVIEAGLKSGELIVVNGLQLVRPEDQISPNRVPMPDDTNASLKMTEVNKNSASIDRG